MKENTRPIESKPRYLSKSDFKIARTCPTKLYYKEQGYPSRLTDDPYLEFLADGGYMVEKMAKLLFKDGREMGNWDEPVKAFEQTQEAILSGDVTLFEATVIHGQMQARIDILRRQGNTLEIIEVKSKSDDADEEAVSTFRGKQGGINSKWRPYLEDVTFQVLLLKRAFPKFEVVPKLCIVDKDKTATDNLTFDKFPFHREPETRGWRRPVVEFTGDVQRLRTEHLLSIQNVSKEVDELYKEVEVAADELVLTLQAEPITKVRPEIGKKCKKCEYRLPMDAKLNGFRDCWGKLAAADPHLLDLYRIDLAGGKNNDLVGALAAEGKSRLADMPQDLLSGATAVRQMLQLDYTAKGEEFVDPKLPTLLGKHAYPLHFIDFEGSRLALPYHTGMHPYEQAAFQWSCHTIRKPGGTIEHTEWLNTEDAFPNFEFARTLREQIGDEGTVYVWWATYELTVLRDILGQMDGCSEKDVTLAKWLAKMTDKSSKRVVDLYQLAKLFYFHPAMKGSLSIKYVLPAVWQSNSSLWEHPLFRRYFKRDKDGKLLNPYDALTALPLVNDHGLEADEIVKEGTGAMRVYQDMMFDRSRTELGVRDSLIKLLLQYCELDTAAMVMIWMHWTKATS
jgi:CRISPR/Cas system-associated exonuclease Cas4 (RecB family)